MRLPRARRRTGWFHSICLRLRGCAHLGSVPAIGTVVGVITGVVPTYFFSRTAASTAQQYAKSAQDDLDQERRRRSDAEMQVRALLNLDPTLSDKAKAAGLDLPR